MKLSLFQIVVRSITHNIRGFLYQFIIIFLLTGVVTGSLMTGKSVRNSLKQTSFEKLGNTGILLSSGIRYFDLSLAARMSAETGVHSVGLLELDGYCQNFYTQQLAPQVKIFAIDNDFFPLHNNESITFAQGEVAINKRLADYLEVGEGDELIIRFNSITDIPADAPFSPGKVSNPSVVMKVAKILTPGEAGNFSLGISQLIPMNIFINRSDLVNTEGKIPDVNRIIFAIADGLTSESVNKAFRKIIRPEDAGLILRPVPATGGFELVTDRIFIDQFQVDQIMRNISSSFPAITYLANTINNGTRSTPYSFISALDPSLYEGVPQGNTIVINEWLAEDLSAKAGDTLSVAWYSPDPMNRLTEEKQDFIVGKVVTMNYIWSDSLLMPEFPGIAGSESCTDWDAGVEIDMRLIRDKDEEYWNRFGGTPKAFISYEKGRELWAGNFGPATSIRFDYGLSENEIREKLTGSLDPELSGFYVSDLRQESAVAASKSVDFSTLFLGLGFFIILSAFMLLILVVSTHYESKKDEVITLYSLGFNNRRIEKQLFLETGLTALTGALAGALAGGFLNLIIIKTLNSVWQGAVQTNTLAAKFDMTSFLTGFAVTMAAILLILKLRSSRFLKRLSEPETGKTEKPSFKINSTVLFVTAAIAILVAVLSFILAEHATLLSYIAGVLIFATCILFIRQYYLMPGKKSKNMLKNISQVSDAYYSFYPSQAIAPVIFLSAGLFAVIITGANKMSISDNMLKPSGGTGGYLLWGEASVPVKGSLTSYAGRKEFGLDDPGLSELSILQGRKTAGNDASCLNLNNIASPPLLGIDTDEFVDRGSFSFAVTMKGFKGNNPWESLDQPPVDETIYGIADQTVMQYGLMIKAGDTLRIRSESGQVLNVVLVAGLKSSVFQGFVLIGIDNFKKYFPSIAGSQIFLADGNTEMENEYISILDDRLAEYGVHFEPAADRLASFFVVTNTYLSVFTILGGIGMILGVAGLGLILIRNFNQRKKDFGIMLAEGFSVITVRNMIFGEHARILTSGIFTGLISAFVATRPSIMSNSDFPWKSLLVILVLIVAAGLCALSISVRTINRDILIKEVRKN
jgi:ABC-type antimicrobial peptide transport system permease subunit